MGPGTALRTLLEAVLVVGRGLELPQVLRQVVEAAVALGDAEYGALGVIGDDHKLAEFVPVGIPDEVRERIGTLPQGHGVLGLLIRHPAPVRIAEISDHPDFHGFPEHHPPLHSFLGVPVRVRDEVFGNLYLANKRSAKEFDAEDESVVSTLAVAAGVAIDNARLLAEGQRRQAWPAAAGEVTSSLLSDRPQEEVLRLVIEHARRNVSADLGIVLVPAEGPDGLRTALADGEGAAVRNTGLRLSARDGFLAAAVSGCEAAVTSDIVNDPRTAAEDAGRWAGFGPAVAVPMGTGRTVHGVLFLARHKGRPVFGAAETRPLAGFAGHAAVPTVGVLRPLSPVGHRLLDCLLGPVYSAHGFLTVRPGPRIGQGLGQGLGSGGARLPLRPSHRQLVVYGSWVVPRQRGQSLVEAWGWEMSTSRMPVIRSGWMRTTWSMRRSDHGYSIAW